MYNDMVKNQIIQEYYNNVSTSIITQKYGVSRTTLYEWLKENNLQVKKIKSFKYERNVNFFSVPNTINSYWAGFIAADGHVSNNKEVSIKLSTEDLNHLMKFKETCEYEGPIHIYDRTDGFPGNSYCVLRINGVHSWCQDLQNNFNIISGNKTFDLIFPRHLNDKNKLSFIVGFIDGDGSISYRKTKKHYALSMVSGSKDMLDGMKEYFDEKYKVTNYQGAATVGSKLDYYVYSLSGKRFSQIMIDIKQFNLPILERKWCK